MLIEDLEEQLSELHTKKFEDKEAADRAKSAMRRKSREKKKKKSATPSRTPRSPRRTRTKKKPELEIMEEQDSFSDD